MSGEKRWWVYLLRCADGTLYAGMTDDVDRRTAVHNRGKGAKYTRGRLPVEAVYREMCRDRSEALRREAALKKLRRAEKEALIAAYRKRQEGARKMREVHFLPSDTTGRFPEGTTVMEAARQAGLWLDSPCGGKGLCGKCRVELRRPGGIWTAALACETPVEDGLEVRLPQREEKLHILTAEPGRTVPLEPLVYWQEIELSGEAGIPLWERVEQALRAIGVEPEPPALSLLARVTAHPPEGGRAWVLLCGGEVLDLTGREPQPLLAAFDIGTTTLAGALLDGRSGETLAVGSARNPQTAFGADVISRIDAAAREGVEPLQRAVLSGLEQVLREMTGRVGREPEEVVLTVLAGNTCMRHLALGLSPASLGQAPYTPAVRAPLCIPAGELGLPVHPAGKVVALPDLAGFVGADTAACLLAAAFDQREELTLLLDIGTNGEMVLGNCRRRIACSTAAGPAFEGARLRCGMRGAAGAVDRVRWTGHGFDCHVIGGEKARGICGSGVLDTAAALLEAGLMDETGALPEPGEAAPHLAPFLTEEEGMPAVILVPGAQSADGSDILFTQKDIRELQLAKGALAAGIQLLAKEYGCALGEIKTVLLAGAFGSTLSPESARRIGLLLPEMEAEVVPVGNAAGEGARLAAVSRAALENCVSLTRETEYLELACHPDFTLCYMEGIDFPKC